MVRLEYGPALGRRLDLRAHAAQVAILGHDVARPLSDPHDRGNVTLIALGQRLRVGTVLLVLRFFGRGPSWRWRIREAKPAEVAPREPLQTSLDRRVVAPPLQPAGKRPRALFIHGEHGLGRGGTLRQGREDADKLPRVLFKLGELRGARRGAESEVSSRARGRGSGGDDVVAVSHDAGDDAWALSLGSPLRKVAGRPSGMPAVRAADPSPRVLATSTSLYRDNSMGHILPPGILMGLRREKVGKPALTPR
jgi:hypothetical protein